MRHLIWTRDRKVGLVVRGDCEGRVTIWELPEGGEKILKRQESFDSLTKIMPKCVAKLEDAWKSDKLRGIVDVIAASGEGKLEVTATTHMRSEGKIVCGRENGTIVIMPIISCASSILLSEQIEPVPTQVMGEHCGRVSCLLYPYNEHPRYDKRHLVSGGVDFSVILWDVASSTQLHIFTVHGGELTQLLVPPNNCNQRVLPCICAVASDHSLSLLHLKDQKCTLLASRHMFPIHAVRWRPHDDFVLVACTDGTVSVWQMETGHLDRVVHGVVAEQMMAACTEKTTKPSETSEDDLTNPTISLAQAFRRRNLATFKALAQQRLTASNVADDKGDSEINVRGDTAPIIIQGLKTNNNDPDAHLLFFDVEALIVQLITEEAAKDYKLTNEPSADSKQELSISSIIAKVKDKAEDVGRGLSSSPRTSPRRAPPPRPAPPGSKPSRPPPPIPKDSLSVQAAKLLMSLLHLWGIDKALDEIVRNQLCLKIPKSMFSFGLVSRGARMTLYVPGAAPRSLSSSRRSSTHRVLSAIAVANALMGDGSYENSTKQNWSRIAAFHCVLLPDMLGDKYVPVSLPELARRWQHRCLEIREAARALLMAELRHMGAEGRQNLVERWGSLIPNYDEKIQSPPRSKDKDTTPVHGPEQEVEEEEDDEEQLLVEGQGLGKRRRQATAIVLMAVIGSEFGAQIAPTIHNREQAAPDGFGIKDYSLAMITSKALSHIVLKSNTQNSIMQRAAIDLLGRGFTVWEPYLDVAAVLLGLLEFCVGSEKLLPASNSRLPLSPAADACRSARNSLEMIAKARPANFISTMAREVARYNALVAQSQTPSATLSNSILIRAKKDILRILEVLVDKSTPNVVQMLIEVVDVSIHCIDSATLKQSGLHELFPALCKLSMLSSCHSSKKVACGSKTGSLAIYDLKHQKCQVFHSHKGQIAAVSMSPDSKYCASYSLVDNTVCIWQFGSSSIFTMGGSQTRCIKTLSAPQWQPSAGTAVHKLARLVWVDPKTLIMLTADGRETKFSI